MLSDTGICLMYVIVLVLMQFGQHKVASNQILYSTLEACEKDRTIMMVELEDTKPEPDAVALSRCVILEPKHSL